MTDMCRVFVVGNFAADFVRRRRDDGSCYGTTTLCVGRTDLRDGQPVTTTVSIPVIVIGASRVATIAQQFGFGSRVLIEGHLEQHPLEQLQSRSWPSDAGEAQGHIAQTQLVVVIDTILNAARAVSAPEAQQQPAQIAWREHSQDNS